MKSLALIFSGLLLFVTLSSHAASTRQLSELRWTLIGVSDLKLALPDSSAVNAFVQSIMPKPEDGFPPITIGEFKFVDLSGDGRIELLCTLFDGSRSYSTVSVISRGPRGFVHSEATNESALSVPSIDEMVIHARSGRSSQILLPRSLRPDLPGTIPAPMAYDIWEFNQDKLRRADLDYTGYYRNVLLPRLRLKLEAAQRLDGRVADRDDEIKADRESIVALQTMLKTGHIPRYNW